MSQVPPTCGHCKFRRRFQYDGATFWKCGHKGGPDREGRPGLIQLNEPPPSFCPRQNGIWQPMVSLFLGNAQREAAQAKAILEANRARNDRFRTKSERSS